MSDHITNKVTINSPDDGCCCDTQRRADEALPAGVGCPHCGASLADAGLDGEKVIIEDNTCQPQEAFRAEVMTCGKCTDTVALVPTAITWNANHNVYYTGGREYLPIEEEVQTINREIDAKIKPLVDQWVHRVSAGEKLTSVELGYWIGSEVQHVIARLMEDARKRPRHGGVRK